MTEVTFSDSQSFPTPRQDVRQFAETLRQQAERVYDALSIDSPPDLGTLSKIPTYNISNDEISDFINRHAEEAQNFHEGTLQRHALDLLTDAGIFLQVAELNAEQYFPLNPDSSDRAALTQQNLRLVQEKVKDLNLLREDMLE